MTKIFTACPYGGLNRLEKVLRKRLHRNDFLITDKDITHLDDTALYTNKERHSYKSFGSAFIRYPYDLIEQHTKTYQAREHTEFIKTLALLFDKINLNSIQKAHFARNRLYSLQKARECGLFTSSSFLIKKDNEKIELPPKIITKSLGNCYFSETLPKGTAKFTKTLLSSEKDGAETAYIYPPHVTDRNKIKSYIENFGTLFLQEKLTGEEYRIFVIDKEIFFYKREKKEKIDQSSAKLRRVVDAEVSNSDKAGLRRLQKSLGLRYLCLDAIVTDRLYIIDINPFGSFPENRNDSLVVDKVAELLLMYPKTE